MLMQHAVHTYSTYTTNMPNRGGSSDDLDLDICYPPDFSRRSSFIKKLLTKEVWKMISLFYYIKQILL